MESLNYGSEQRKDKVKVGVASAYVEKEGTRRRESTEPKLSPHHTDKALALIKTDLPVLC